MESVPNQYLADRIAGKITENQVTPIESKKEEIKEEVKEEVKPVVKAEKTVTKGKKK